MVRPGYKRTEVGEIPEDWEVVRLRGICRLVNGRGFKPHEWRQSGLPIIRIQNLNGSPDFNYFEGTYDPKLEIRPGQLLFAWSGSKGTSFGPHVWGGPTGLLNYHTWKVVPTRTSTRFLFHKLRQLTSVIEGWAHGASALVHVQKWQMEGFELSLPPRSNEQNAIASTLSHADSQVEALEHLLAKKRAIKQGVMQSLLTGAKRLPGFTEPWEKRRLGDVLTVCHGKSQAGVASHDGSYPILASGGRIGWATCYLHEGPSVLIGRKGTIDSPQFMETPFWSVDTLFFTKIGTQHSARFIFYRFLLIEWRRYNEASGVPSLSAKTIESIEIDMPSFPEQAAIAEVLADLDADLDATSAKLQKARDLKQCMMQELLTGRIRLV